MGLDAIAVITPYYVKPSQEELAEHYIEVCRAVRLPVMAYNFPQHGGMELEPKTLGRIAAAAKTSLASRIPAGRSNRRPRISSASRAAT